VEEEMKAPIKKELAKRERVRLERELEKVQGARIALEEDLPYELMVSLEDNESVRDVTAALKAGGVDGSEFLASLKEATARWRVLAKVMSKRVKELRKQEDALFKKLDNN
jgi:hypothetical protein